MLITCSPRIVAAPWESDLLKGRRVRVGREAEVLPDPGPVAAYRSVFPDRRVAWNAAEQLYEITQVDGVTGEEARLELVFYWDYPPKEDGTEWTDDEVAAMVQARTGGAVRRFMDFDYRFVERRLRERTLFLELGAVRYNRRIADRNAARSRTKIRGHANDLAASLGEFRRWIPVVAGDTLGSRVPLVPGAALSAPTTRKTA
jgi:hypothetical protein